MLALPLVTVLLVPDEELVELVLVVKVRSSIDRPTSYADFRCRSLGSDFGTPPIDDFGRSKGFILGGTAGGRSSSSGGR